ncbi:ribonuclease H-like domain-containing protein [Tanacetum coccineum]
MIAVLGLMIPMMMGGDSTVSDNTNIPDNSTDSPKVNTVDEAVKDHFNVQTDNSDTAEEDVYMSIPEKYSDKDDKRVCKLVNLNDFSLFVKNDNDVMLILLVYVDDIIVTGNNVDGINKFKQFLGTKFWIKNIGKLKYFLGIEVLDIDNGISLTQRKYCTEFLTEFGMLACKPCSTPIEVNPDDKKDCF